MSQSLARKLLLFANQIIRRRVSFDIIICFSVKAFWGFPALRCTFLLDFCCEVSRGTATFTSGPIRSQMKFYILEANTNGLLIGNKNTFKTGFCKCELLRYEKSSANWLVGFDFKMQFKNNRTQDSMSNTSRSTLLPALMMRKERHLCYQVVLSVWSLYRMT